jgi:DNA-binding transcriptional LysR family regulator
MDIHQLKTFIAVAREGSITRASERLHLSQPAVSAHIKAIEDALDLTLFDRTARGMSLTVDGQRLLAKAEQTLGAHQELMEEATRIKGKLSGKLRLGANSNSDNAAVGRLLTVLSERYPEVEVVLKHGTSGENLTALRAGSLDAAFYNEAAEPADDLATNEVSRFRIFVVASPGLVSSPPDWKILADMPWIYPAASGCWPHCRCVLQGPPDQAEEDHQRGP